MTADDGIPRRGKCLYKTGKCENERALKTNGQPHNLCDMHRLRQNQNQRKLDGKNRHQRNQQSTAMFASSPEPPTYAYAPYPPSPLYAKPDIPDDITVRTPSYLKGEAREAFRSRVLQKLVNIISEEVLTTPAYPEFPPIKPAYSYGPPPSYYDRAFEYAPPPLEPRPYSSSIFQQSSARLPPMVSLPPLTQCIAKDKTNVPSPTFRG
ncbi:hypothetical protein ACHHYP_01470 [Achlya hypogyna]|uniref:Uncharacterized protein n=1 Tax=Achlya hypogyna TaxID=1202772 RepID=A0A1V9Z915_ACHHY|nr:hypothetical protein ACHHYP_01470 [Achlya hypogyna]